MTSLLLSAYASDDEDGENPNSKKRKVNVSRTFLFHFPSNPRPSFSSVVSSRFSQLFLSSSHSFLSELRSQSEFYSHSLPAETVKNYAIRQFGTNFENNVYCPYESLREEDFYEKIEEKQNQIERERWKENSAKSSSARNAANALRSSGNSLLTSTNESFPFEQLSVANRNLSIGLLPFGSAMPTTATSEVTATAASNASTGKRTRWGSMASSQRPS